MANVELPGRVTLGIAHPADDTPGPLVGRLMVANDKIPFTYTIDSPDPKFFHHIAKLLKGIGDQLGGSAANAPYRGTHDLTNTAEEAVETTATEVVESNDTTSGDVAPVGEKE